jgi:hypothetical protein
MDPNYARLAALMAQGDMGGAFQEDVFLRKVQNTPWFGEFQKQYGETPDLNYGGFDYRGAVAAGNMPTTRDPYDPTQTEALDQAAFGMQPRGTYHWGSANKAADHPTLWKEQFMQLDPQGRNPDGLGIRDGQAASRQLLKPQQPPANALIRALMGR